jgi:cell division protein FtsB
MKQWPGDPPEVTTIWKAISRCLWWAISIVLVCIGLAVFKPQMHRRAKLDAQITALRAERSSAKATHEALKSRLEWLKNEPAYLEIQARDRLDIARENETVFRFPVER